MKNGSLDCEIFLPTKTFGFFSIMNNVVFTAFFVLSWILWNFLHFTPSPKTPATMASLYFSCCMPLIMIFLRGEMIILMAREMQMYFFPASKGPNISITRQMTAYICNRGGKIGVKSLRAEQVSVICSLGAWCQPYNSDLDSHKRQNSFELHMLDCALQVNPGSAVTSRLRPGDGTPARPQQQDWVLGVLLGQLIGEFPLNKLHLICLGTRAELAFWGLIFSTRSQGNEEAQRPPNWGPGPLKKHLAPLFLINWIEALRKKKGHRCFVAWIQF